MFDTFEGRNLGNYEVEKIFLTESCNYKLFGDIIVREVKTVDQYIDYFSKIIKRYYTATSICGYFVSAISPLLADRTTNLMDIEKINTILLDLNVKELVEPHLEQAMKTIYNQRAKYISEFAHEFSTPKEKNKYLKDWIANYEISDVMREQCFQRENLFFFRQNPFNFPKEVQKIKHEELKRLKDIEHLKEEEFIIEKFCVKNGLIAINQFKQENYFKTLIKNDKSMILICDLVGHFVCFVVCFVFYNDTIEKNIILVNSTENNYIFCRKKEIEAIADLTFQLNKDLYSKINTKGL